MRRCQYNDCDGKPKARGLCLRHARQADAGILGIDYLRTAESWDDGVRSPDDLPVKPKMVAEITTNRQGSQKGRTMWAVIMPYPSLDRSQPCQGFEDLFDDDGRNGKTRTNRDLAEAATLCNKCPFQTECFEWAMAHEESGFWAGTTRNARKALRVRRNQSLVTLGLGVALNGPFADRDWSGVLDREAALWSATQDIEPLEEVESDEWEVAPY